MSGHSPVSFLLVLASRASLASNCLTRSKLARTRLRVRTTDGSVSVSLDFPRCVGRPRARGAFVTKFGLLLAPLRAGMLDRFDALACV